MRSGVHGAFRLPLLMKLQLVFMSRRTQKRASNEVHSFYLFIAALQIPPSYSLSFMSLVSSVLYL